MKKVLFIATRAQKHIIVFHTPYLKWFKDNGYEVHVCAGNDLKLNGAIPHCDRFYELRFERSPYKFSHFQTFKALKEIIVQNNYDLVHCHTPMGGVLGRLAARGIRQAGTSVIYTAHGFHFYSGAPLHHWLIYYPIEKWLSRITDVLITINKEDYARARKSFKAGRIEYVVGVGLDAVKYEKPSIGRVEKRKQLGLEEDDFIIGSVGELNKNKNHETIIEAVYNLKNPKMKYLISGEGPLRQELTRLIHKRDLTKQVLLLGYRADVQEINSVTDVFVLPSLREGLSVALMEAMACGLPVICSNIRGNRDLITHGQGGFLVEPRDALGFQRSIKTLFENQVLRQKMGEHNLLKSQNSCLSVVREKMASIYENAINPR